MYRTRRISCKSLEVGKGVNEGDQRISGLGFSKEA